MHGASELIASDLSWAREVISHLLSGNPASDDGICGIFGFIARWLFGLFRALKALWEYLVHNQS